jgi:hypothetical protein
MVYVSCLFVYCLKVDLISVNQDLFEEKLKFSLNKTSGLLSLHTLFYPKQYMITKIYIYA